MTSDINGKAQALQYIALCFGFSLAVNAWLVSVHILGDISHPLTIHDQRVFFRISGGLFNPAVTFGLCLIGALPWIRGALLFGAQVLGGMAAAGLIYCMLPGPLAAETTLGGGTTVTQGVFLEMILTAELAGLSVLLTRTLGLTFGIPGLHHPAASGGEA